MGEVLKIDGFGIAQYRSFGEEMQLVGPFSKINFFVGQNNSGKSNILKFIAERYSAILTESLDGANYSLEQADAHLGVTSNIKKFAIGISLQSIRSKYSHAPGGDVLEKLVRALSLEEFPDTAWVKCETVAGGETFDVSKESIDAVKHLAENEINGLRALWSSMNAGATTAQPSQIYKGVLFGIANCQKRKPTAKVIPAIRQIEFRVRDVDYALDGTGIISKLARLQRPNLSELKERAKFEKINEFLKRVTGNRTAEISIPDDKSAIHVEMDGRTLDLKDLGTGIHEVIILASASTIFENVVFCIEEPELHLHPLLQRKLVRYLEAKTNNQYFFTTHSAHFLDTPGAQIFHVRFKDGSSIVEHAANPTKKSAICFDLGYLASDILQANCVIWVEGPTDRIYLNHWIQALDPNLIEGIHYSIMFYGGRLLSHLTANDPEVNEFISLRRLNRRIAIVIDSDRKTPWQKLNATKVRVHSEFSQTAGFSWITKGREIENYVSPKILLQAIKGLYPSAHELVSESSYEHSYHFKTETGEITEVVDKVKIAREVTKYPCDFSVLDLRKRVTDIVTFIRDSNASDPDFLS